MMPWQLKEGLKRRPKGAPPRPIVEQLPAISVNDSPIPSYHEQKRIHCAISACVIRRLLPLSCPVRPSNSATFPCIDQQ